MTAPSLTVTIIFTLTSRTEIFLRGFDALAEDGVLDKAEVGGENGFVNFVYNCDGVFGVSGEGTNLAPVAGRTLFFEVLVMLALEWGEMFRFKDRNVVAL